MSKKHKPTSEFRPFNRMEISIAEIMRLNYPLTKGEEADLWMDLVEALSKMFALKDSRFDSDGFWERCYGEIWSDEEAIREEVRESEKLSVLMDQAAALDSAADDVHIGT